MIDLRTIEEEISKLEESHASYPVCEKLADLYVVRDHLGGGASFTRNGSNYERYGRNNYNIYDDYYSGRMMDDEMTGRGRMSMPR